MPSDCMSYHVPVDNTIIHVETLTVAELNVRVFSIFPNAVKSTIYIKVSSWEIPISRFEAG